MSVRNFLVFIKFSFVILRQSSSPPISIFFATFIFRPVSLKQIKTFSLQVRPKFRPAQNNEHIWRHFRMFAVHETFCLLEECGWELFALAKGWTKFSCLSLPENTSKYPGNSLSRPILLFFSHNDWTCHVCIRNGHHLRHLCENPIIGNSVECFNGSSPK